MPEQKRHEIEAMVKALIDSGWKRKFGNVWQSPSGALFYGPAYAYQMMLEHPNLAIKVTTRELTA